MNYRISIEKKPRKFISSLPANQRMRVLNAISKLPSGNIKTIQGHDGFFRLRVGNYRIIFTLIPETQELTLILVTDADNRGQIYKRY